MLEKDDHIFKYIFLTLLFIIPNYHCNRELKKVKKEKIHMCLIKGPEQKDTLDLVGDSNYLWDKKVVNVFFWDDDGNIGDKIINIASEWTPYSGIRFRKTFDRLGSDIRVSFRTDGWWSYIGSYSSQVGLDSITLSLDSIYLKEHTNRLRNVVLHEFGHSLGLIHEHQHPGFLIPWKRKELFQYYNDTYGVDSAWVIEQVIEKFDYPEGIYCTPDPRSIMIYAIPPGITDNNIYVIDWPPVLSPLDKLNIKRIYQRKPCID